LHIFVSVFIRNFSFVHVSDRLACYSRDHHRSFVLLVFWFLLLLESYIFIFGLRCQVRFIWCWFQLRKNRKKVRREVWACEDIKCLSETRAMWGKFFLQLTNSCRYYYHVRSKQHTTPSQCRT
jgi:hypothetical protein